MKESENLHEKFQHVIWQSSINLGLGCNETDAWDLSRDIKKHLEINSDDFDWIIDAINEKCYQEGVMNNNSVNWILRMKTLFAL